MCVGSGAEIGAEGRPRSRHGRGLGVGSGVEMEMGDSVCTGGGSSGGIDEWPFGGGSGSGMGMGMHPITNSESRF